MVAATKKPVVNPEIRKAWAKVKRTAKAHEQAVVELTLLLNPQQADVLGIKATPKKEKKRPTSTTYAQAMEGWRGKLSVALSHDRASAVIASHPWTAANIGDPVEWCRIQLAKYTGILGSAELREEVVKALGWMHDNRSRVGGRVDAAKFLGTWVTRAMERRPARPPRGGRLFEQSHDNVTDLDEPRRDR